jgi:hypothetical protein
MACAGRVIGMQEQAVEKFVATLDTKNRVLSS